MSIHPINSAIEYPTKTITSSELAVTNRTVTNDGVVNRDDFVVSVISLDEANSKCSVSVSAGSCWIAGRFLKTVDAVVFDVSSEKEKLLIKIRCDTTGSGNGLFSIVADEETPLYSAGLYEIVIGSIEYGVSKSCAVPLSIGGESCAGCVYVGVAESYIQIRKMAPHLAFIKFNMSLTSYNAQVDDIGRVMLDFIIPEEYRPNDYDPFYFENASVEFGLLANGETSDLYIPVRCEISSDGHIYIKTKIAIAGEFGLYGSAVYPI